MGRKLGKRVGDLGNQENQGEWGDQAANQGYLGRLWSSLGTHPASSADGRAPIPVDKFRVPLLLLGVGLFLASVGIAAIRGKGGNQGDRGNKGDSGSKDVIFEAGEDRGLIKRPVFVDVSGAVIKPGVYELGADARIKDALIAAGGLSAGADREFVSKAVNMAAPIADGAKIYIPEKGEGGGLGGKGGTGTTGEIKGIGVIGEVSGLININTAGQGELERLPRIGPAIAGRIIDYRMQNGRFESIEDIKKVRGIGEKTFEEIQERITVY